MTFISKYLKVVSFSILLLLVNSIGARQMTSLFSPDWPLLETETITHFEQKAQSFESYIDNLYQILHLKDKALAFQVFRQGMIGYYNLLKTGHIKNKDVVSIIDYEKASIEKRLYVVDLKTQKLLYHSLVAHGKNTGSNYAKHFSNTPNSLQSSLGLFSTAHTYMGKHGYSLRLNGLESNINDRAYERAIVIHGADYVSRDFIQQHGRLGRSWGCPSLPRSISQEIIDFIKNGSCIFIHFDNDTYIETTQFQNYNNAVEVFLNETA